MAWAVENQRWEKLEEFFGASGVRQIRDAYDSDPDRVVRLWREAAAQCKNRFDQDASHCLTRLGRINFSRVETQKARDAVTILLGGTP